MRSASPGSALVLALCAGCSLIDAARPSPDGGDNGGGGGGYDSPRFLQMTTGIEHRGLAVGNLNQDGHPDLAFISPNTLGLAYGMGDGQFIVNQQSTNDAQGPIAIGDFNNDGMQDVAVAVPGTIEVFLSNGPMNSFDRRQVAVAYEPQELLVGDLGGDPADDLATFEGATVHVLIDPVGAIVATPSPQIEGISSMAVGDFDADGEAELAASVGTKIVVLVRPLWEMSPARFFELGDGFAASMVATRLDSNPRDDLLIGWVCADCGGDRIRALISGGGTFDDFFDLTFMTPGDLVAGDFDGDGRTDVGAIDASGGAGGASSDFALLRATQERLYHRDDLAAGGTPSGVVAGQFNGDQRTDFAFSVRSNGVTLVLSEDR